MKKFLSIAATSLLTLNLFTATASAQQADDQMIEVTSLQSKEEITNPTPQMTSVIDDIVDKCKESGKTDCDKSKIDFVVSLNLGTILFVIPDDGDWVAPMTGFGANASVRAFKTVSAGVEAEVGTLLLILWQARAGFIATVEPAPWIYVRGRYYWMANGEALRESMDQAYPFMGGEIGFRVHKGESALGTEHISFRYETNLHGLKTYGFTYSTSLEGLGF